MIKFVPSGPIQIVFKGAMSLNPAEASGPLLPKVGSAFATAMSDHLTRSPYSMSPWY